MRISFLFYVVVTLLATGSCTEPGSADESTPESAEVETWPRDSTRSISGLQAERGLKGDDLGTNGYVLFQPSKSTSTYLMNKSGEIVHEWIGDLNSMQSYLLPNGHLMRLERDIDFPVFAAGGQSGRIREYTWDGELVWDFEYASAEHLTHHDIEPMANGNVLAISYEVKSTEEAIQAGRHLDHVPPAGIWPDKVIEIKPTGPNSGEIVWEWKMWDHLVQDIDPEKDNYGDLSEHPRRINLNVFYEEGPPMSREEIEQMKKMGALTSNATFENQGSDITHVNAISYNPDLDQIALSSPAFSEIWVIDHSTTTDEARGSTGGRWGHGGDLLYRWGNPGNYGRGSEEDRMLYEQHDVRWVSDGLPGSGNLMVFNNNIPGPSSNLPSVFVAFMDSVAGFNPDPQVSVADWSNYSAVYEFKAPVDSDGAYVLPEDAPFGPDELEWKYMPRDTYSFYSPFVSGAHRLANGNTFIISGAQGRFFEVTSDKDIVWEYWQPYMDGYTLPDGSEAQPTGPFMFAQFRAALLMPDHPGLANKKLKPLAEQPEQFVFGPPSEGPPQQ